MKYMVINKTDLTREEIGKMMDQIIRDCEVDTLYYGKVNKYRIAHGKTFAERKGYSVEVRYLKRYVKWTFTEV